MNNEQLYGPDQVAQILHAYRAIFPTITPELADYWGLERKRTWSCVTTDFHLATFEKLRALHERTLEIDQQGLDPGARGRALREAALATGVGFSIGISPWTDNLLARTYKDDKESVVILLGHDWYPIVTGDRPSGTPLISWDSLHEVKRYWPGAPEAVLDGSTVGLFVNLYPDYRPPGDPKCGNLAKYGYSYAQCLSGLDALVAAVRKRFSQVRVISWGSNVWDAVLPRLADVRPNTLLSAAVKDAPGRVLSIKLGGQVVPYLPLMHPGHWGNFGRAYHLRHVKAGYAALGLGLPGMANSQIGQVRVAREIALL
jgi:hypothetical protein